MSESLALSLQTSQSSATALEGVNETTREIHSQVENTATVVNSLSADMKTLIDVSRQNQITPYVVAGVEMAMEKVLQKHTFRAQESPRSEGTSCISVRVAERGIPHRQLDAARRGSHYHSRREFLCQNPLIKICKTTSTAKSRLAEVEDIDGTESTAETVPSYDTITTYEVSVNLGLWRRGLKAVAGRLRNAYSPVPDFRLTTYYIVDQNAPVCQAAGKYDIGTARMLFSSGSASPFDQLPWGDTLFDIAFASLSVAPGGKDNAVKGLNFLKFILVCGGGPNTFVNLGAILELSTVIIPFDRMKIFVDVLWLALEASTTDPTAHWNIAHYVTLKSERTPAVKFLRRQDTWPWKLEPTVFEPNQDSERTIYETDLHISEDEEGVKLAPLLSVPFRYSVSRARSWGLFSIFELYWESEFQQKIRTGCINRIALLLRAGHDPRACKLCKVNCSPLFQLRMSVTQHVQFTKTSDLWQEALEISGWSQTEIHDLFEDEMYCGVPELFDGKLEFKSQATNREEFIRAISMGEYHDRASLVPQQLAIYLQMDLFDVWSTIDEARHVLNMKFIPGSWQEDEASTLAFGVDFFLWGYAGMFTGWKRYSSFEEYDKRFK